MIVFSWRLRAACLAGAAMLSGCDLAPAYHPPQFVLPASYAGSAPFTVARPADAAPRGPWWQSFNDPTLDRLEAQLTKDNPDLQAEAERYTQARDLAAEARSGLFPQIGTSGLLSENKQSDHRLFRSSSGNNEATSNQVLATASWEPDFWDEIRNQTRIQKRLAQGQAAVFAAARLSLQAELASDYIALRGLDTEDAVYRQTISDYAHAVEITTLRETARIASGLDVARAQNQLSSAQAAETDVVLQRAVLLHAIAVLVGAEPSVFTIPPVADTVLTVPVIPAGVPSQLLERRPDIAEAERTMAAANAGIGVARAAFYPRVTLSAVAGFEDTGFNLVSLPNSLWSVGASAMLPLFEGGLRQAELQRAWSHYAETRGEYRAVVLSAFQEVEDGLARTQQLATEAQQQQQAAQAALQAQQIALILYTGGLDNYLNVVVAQVAALTARIANVQVQARHLQAAVGLIRALGGGWSTKDLPTDDQVLPFNPLTPTPPARAEEHKPGSTQSG